MREGDEIAQLYVTPPSGAVPRPIRELKGFTRVSLKPGEAKSVTITFSRGDLAYWDPGTRAWTVAPGDYLAQIGSSSRQLPLQAGFSE